MRIKTVEMTLDQIDAIIIEELKEAHELNLRLNTDEGGQYIEPDHELLSSIEKVLEYYMSPTEYEKWYRQLTDKTKPMSEYYESC